MSDAPCRNDLHLPRRIFHMAGGLGIVLLGRFYFQSDASFQIALIAMTLLWWGFESLRFVFEPFNQLVLKVFRPIVRNGECRAYTGSAFYMVGCCITALLFDRRIAEIAILILAFGDAFASIVGIYVSGRRATGPSWAGSLACGCVGFVLALGLFFQEGLGFALLVGVIALLAERIQLIVDDNLSIPLLSGFFIWLILIALPTL